MPAQKPLNVGVIGYGFMGRTHSNAYRKVTNFFDTQHRPVLKVICGRDAEKTKQFAEKWGYESVESDWRRVVERKDVDAIDICTPNNTHKEIAIAAAKAGKMILCEKPLSMDTREGEEMVRAVEAAKVLVKSSPGLPCRTRWSPASSPTRSIEGSGGWSRAGSEDVHQEWKKVPSSRMDAPRKTDRPRRIERLPFPPVAASNPKVPATSRP